MARDRGPGGDDLEVLTPGSSGLTPPARAEREGRHAHRLRSLAVVLLVAGVVLAAGAPVYAVDARSDARAIAHAWVVAKATMAEGRRIAAPSADIIGSDESLAFLSGSGHQRARALADLAGSVAARRVVDPGLRQTRDEVATAISAYARSTEAVALVLDEIRALGGPGRAPRTMPALPDVDRIDATVAEQLRKWRLGPARGAPLVAFPAPPTAERDEAVRAALGGASLVVAATDGVHVIRVSPAGAVEYSVIGGSASGPPAAITAAVGFVLDGVAKLVSTTAGDSRSCSFDPATSVARTPHATLLFASTTHAFEVNGQCHPVGRLELPEGMRLWGETVGGLVLQDAQGGVLLRDRDGTVSRPLADGPATVLGVVDKFVAVHSSGGIDIDATTSGGDRSRLRWAFPSPPVAAALAPNGDLAYATPRGADTAVWMASREGGSREAMLLPGRGRVALAWSATGAIVAVVYDEVAARAQLVVRTHDGRRAVRELAVGRPLAIAIAF